MGVQVNLISVLVPVFNNEKTIRRCIESILNQTYGDWELLLFLDGSQDNSVEIARSYGGDRIKVIESRENVGIAAARNSMLELATGEFIAFLDADDYMLPDRLKVQSNYLLSHKEIDICGSAALLRNYLIKERTYFKNHDLIQAFQFFKCGVLFPTVMTRNFYTDNTFLFDESFGSRASDFEWLYRVGMSKTICNLPMALTSYYVSTMAEIEVKKRIHAYDDKAISLLESKCNGLLDKEVDIAVLSKMHAFLLSNDPLELDDANSIAILLMDLLKANNLRGKHDKRSFEAIILLQILRLKRNSDIKGYGYSRLFRIFGVSCFVIIARLSGLYR